MISHNLLHNIYKSNVDPANKNILISLRGQSNAVGAPLSDTNVNDTLNNDIPRSYIWYNDQWSVLNINTCKLEGEANGHGCELNVFYKLSQYYTDYTFYLVKVASGGKSVDEEHDKLDWNADSEGELNDWSINGLNQAIINLNKNGINFNYIADVWIQWERDAGSSVRAEEYKKNWINMNIEYRSRVLRVPYINIINIPCQEIIDWYYTENSNVIKNYVNEIVSNKTWAKALNLDGVPLRDDQPTVHFSSSGYNEIGLRVYNILVDEINNL